MKVMRKYVLILALAVPLSAAAQYTIIDLGTLGGDWSGTGGINASGHVVGYSHIPPSISRAFLWRNGGMFDLGVLPGYDRGDASAVNDSVWVVGVSIRGYEPEERRATLWRGGTITDLGTLGGSYSTASGVNNSGQVVGSAEPNAGGGHAYLWENGFMTDLGTLPGELFSGAADINEQAQVVGYSYRTDFRAVLWENGAITDLGTLGGEDSSAYAINDSAQAVGSSELSPGGSEHAFLWESGVMTDLGTLLGNESSAFDINAAGDVVGWSGRRAFLWRNGAMTDLNDLLPTGSGWELRYANGINDAGQIVGQGIINGRYHAYRMTPVPEPGTFAALSVALLVLLRRRRR
ncbi:MAG: DUF3466 family protein [Armatimonadetes bacterium]|nr:DUF3466 family protein [Armatimonadota bacterium]